MSILDELTKHETWERFKDYKTEHSLLSFREKKDINKIVEDKSYLPFVETLNFSYPTKKIVNKKGTTKKRVVYTLPHIEMWVMKVLAWLVNDKYESAFHRNCYSFRKSKNAKKAYDRIMRIRGLRNKYLVKVDIHDYFNSIPVDGLCNSFREIITDDEPLLNLLCDFFSTNKAYYKDELIEEKRGAMAGLPLSPFCANIYLRDVDQYFDDKHVPYFRYSDDILIIAKDEEQLNECFEELKQKIYEKGLELNPKKVAIFKPGDAWDFLGFKYDNGKVDLADITLKKIKDKIRRKAKALYRWKLRKDANYERTARAMIKKFNRKFYDIDEEAEFTWQKWYFPVITQAKTLEIIDDYLIEYIRYLYSGRHYKKNYEVSYEQIKEYGFKSLVNSYYHFKKEQQKHEKELARLKEEKAKNNNVIQE